MLSRLTVLKLYYASSSISDSSPTQLTDGHETEVSDARFARYQTRFVTWIKRLEMDQGKHAREFVAESGHNKVIERERESNGEHIFINCPKIYIGQTSQFYGDYYTLTFP